MNTMITRPRFLSLLALTVVTMPVLAAGPMNDASNNTVNSTVIGKVNATGTATPDAGMGWSVKSVQYELGTTDGMNFTRIGDPKAGTLVGANYVATWTGQTDGQRTVRMTAVFQKAGSADITIVKDAIITVR
jgi:hypothetical protein